MLTFLIAGGGEVGVWRGNWAFPFNFSEHFEMKVYPLAGKTMHLELFDSNLGDWGHIMLDHVLLLTPDARG